jgi:hypothetical protein
LVFFFFFWLHSHEVSVNGDSTSRGNAKHHTTRDTGGINLQFPKSHFSSFVSFVRLFDRSIDRSIDCWSKPTMGASLRCKIVGVNNNVLTTPLPRPLKLHGQLTPHVRLSNFGILIIRSDPHSSHIV